MVVKKEEARSLVFDRRKSLDAFALKRTSFKVSENLSFYIRKTGFKKISIYLSYGKEPSTDSLVAYCLSLGLEVYVPVADYSQKKLYHARLADLSRVKKDAKGIRIPENPEKLYPPSEVNLDAVVCPGIAFDLSGNRVGHGEGFYDIFLKEVGRAHKIGVCFEFQLFDSLETYAHDVRMDAIVTEERIIEISASKSQQE